MNIVEEIVRSGLCAGCGLCQSIAPPESIKMQYSKGGFLRPVISGENLDEYYKQIERICPGVKVEHKTTGDNYDKDWGPIESVNVGYAIDATVRRTGSSGGAISALCIYLLESGQIDFIAQIAADESNPIANRMQLSRTAEDVIKAAGSRYAPSAPLANLRELLKTGERFAFVGKPCDVAALRTYLHEYPEYKSQIPILLSFMCAGIPSQNATIDVIKAMGAVPEKVRSFRYRGDGWPGMARAIENGGEVYEMDYNNSWGNILGKQLQFRCKICADGIGEFADIVCADAWYGKDGYPDFAEREGRSLIISRTEIGENLLKNAEKDSVIAIEKSSIQDIVKMQPFQLIRRRLAAARYIATKLAQGRATTFKRLKIWRNFFSAGPIVTLRNAWGTYRRAIGE